MKRSTARLRDSTSGILGGYRLIPVQSGTQQSLKGSNALNECENRRQVGANFVQLLLVNRLSDNSRSAVKAESVDGASGAQQVDVKVRYV